MQRVQRVRLAIIGLMLAGIVSGAACRTPDDGAARSASPGHAAAGRDALLPVTLPGLEGAEPGLQERLRARHASLDALGEAVATSDTELAAAYGEVGKILLGAEFLSEAEPYFSNAQRLEPINPAWPYYLAHVHRLRNQPDQAIALFEQTLERQPDLVPALVWLGATLLDMGRAGDAVTTLRRAVSLSPKSVAARYWSGQAAMAGGDHARAVQELEAALALDPQAHPVHYPLAMAYRAAGNERRAADHLTEWKEGRITPDDPLMDQVTDVLQTAVGYEVRGTQALEAGRWREAAALFRRGLETSPRDPALHQNLGTALFLGGDAAAALAEFQEAVRLSPGYARAHFSLGVLMDANGRDAEAVQRYRDAVKYDPTLMNARFGLADALRRSGRLDEAVSEYEQILTADPGASQARFGLAMARVRLGRYRDARAALESAARTHPDQPGFTHALARVLAAAPDDSVRDGVRAWTIVQALEKRYGPSLALSETAAMTLAELGRFEEAVRLQRETVEAAAAQGRVDLAPTLRRNLALYEASRPCRQPWADDDPVHHPRPSFSPT